MEIFLQEKYNFINILNRIIKYQSLFLSEEVLVGCAVSVFSSGFLVDFPGPLMKKIKIAKEITKAAPIPATTF